MAAAYAGMPVWRIPHNAGRTLLARQRRFSLSPGAVALTVISVIVGVGSCVGFLARYHHKMDLDQWIVGGRGFGLILVWVLTAGELFTTFTFLGASGWAYAKGAPVYYILGYAPLACVVAFYLLPPVWEVGQRFHLQTQADFFQVRYGSKYLAALVAIIGAVCLLPYIQIQLVGLGMIVEAASFGAIPRTPAMVVAFALVAGFVLVSGVRGIAWVSVIKDALLLICAVFVGFAIPAIYFGGVGKMFAALATAKPNHLVMPGATSNLGHSWYISTVLLISLAFYMWPQFFGAAFTARSGQVLRRNAMVMPFYIIVLPLVLLVGFTAVLVNPGLKVGDLSMLVMVRKTFPAWFLGIVGGAGVLTAMVPSAIQLLTGATLYAKNVYRPLFSPAMSDERVGRLAKVMVMLLTLGALLLAIYTTPSIVSLQLLGFAGVSQLFPGVVLGLFSKRVTDTGVLSGLIVGISVAVVLVLLGLDPFKGLNAGFIALCLNLAVTGLVSAITKSRVNGFADPPPAAFSAAGG